MHPLTPLLPDEIAVCAAILRAKFPLKNFHFKAITLREPLKAALLAWLEGTGPTPPREAYVCYYIRGTPHFFESVIDIAGGALLSDEQIKAGYHGPADGPEIEAAEKAALADAGVQAALEKLCLPEGSVVVADPWIYGSDGVTDAKRQFQCFLYLQSPHGERNPDSNHYAFPLTISPVVDVETMTVVRIDHLPTGADATPTPPKPYRVPPPSEYTPEHQSLRTDLKPLHVVQPAGASFTVTEEVPDSGGAVIEWQKWRLRTGFNHREGMVLYNIAYDGRDIAYRISLSDMSIPYADPRPPYHKKAAFDLGDAGAGVMANNLKLGCDCLGSIHYLSSNLSTDVGTVLAMPNVICIHEQDSGIGFKHTNYRTGRPVVTRNRELVLQSIITVSNYEYILAFIFGQSGEFHYEVRATGILSTAPIEPGVEVPWGTVVHPGVLAAHHQHIFSLRVDPQIDGAGNKVVYEEAVALPADDDDAATNPFGVGYVTRTTELTHSQGIDTRSATNRVFHVQSTTKTNPINRLPVGYKLTIPPFQKLLAQPRSLHHARVEFGDHALYVTKYREGELFAAGKWTNQSRGGEGVRSWAARADPLDRGDPVLFVQFGINHIPRIEDFPVMPAEVLRVSFKPANFFSRNPGIDVPPSTQAFNASVLLSGKPTTTTDGERECCD
ncbi:copper amine oxidase [Sphaerosporella brunnea]|uniref:Amine oxidase n=1 Tax=Sphaerosporella brunnea TaxID=1250544 RepID=A0A5J5F8N8_9PEZI|nr:copper amine oxidase [Sphaerosporella brunnea]